jgi:hypothetical protein
LSDFLDKSIEILYISMGHRGRYPGLLANPMLSEGDAVI